MPRSLKCLLGLSLSVLTLSSISGQQLRQLPATSDEIDFFHYLLRSMADPAIDRNMAKQNESNIILEYGLDGQEAAAFHSAGQRFAADIDQFRKKRRTILAGKVIAGHADELALAAVSAELEERVASTTNQLLQLLRPGKAALLRLQGQLVGQATAAAKAKVFAEASQTNLKGAN